MKTNPLPRRQFLQYSSAAIGGALAPATAQQNQKGEAMTSKIASIETFTVGYPVVGHFKFFKTKDGKTPTRDTVVVKVTDENGKVGWGQSVPSPTWSYETLESAKTTIDRHLGPALIGQDAFDIEAIEAIMERSIAPSFSTGQPICKAGIDLALFDLTGQVLKQSAAQRWQRNDRKKITLSWTLNPRTLEEVGELVEQARKQNFHNFNVKVGSDAKFDVEMCREIRRLAPQAFVWIDANGGYDLETALAVAPKFADIGMAAFEQPLPANRLSWYKKLMKQKALPILMDEPIVSLVDLEEFHQLGLLDGVAMKVSRCGGLTESRKIIEYLEQNGLLFFASGLTDPDLALVACLHLFAAYGLERPAALNAPQFLSGSILRDPLPLSGDQASLPDGPGLGVEVDEKKLKNMLRKA